MKEYRIVTYYHGGVTDDGDTSVFSSQVNNSFKEGWECQGGVCVSDDTIYQAITREIPNEPR